MVGVEAEHFPRLKREFGQQFKGVYVRTAASTDAGARELLRQMES
jgi:hypothetical protein